MTTPSKKPKSNVRDIGMPTNMAAEYLGVSPNTIRQWSDQGYLKCRRTPGGQRRYAKAALDRFLNELDDKAESGEAS